MKNEYKNQIEIEEKNQDISYDNFSMNEALKIIMNAATNNSDAGEKFEWTDKDVPSGFEIIGDVAHLNLNQ